MLEEVIPEDINRRTFDFMATNPLIMPSEILRENWFVQNVILNSTVTGAVRSLLGKNFSLPNLMANHRVTGPLPAQVWHRDGGSLHEPNLRYLQVFYYPQECTVDMGPTELLPGSHFLFSLPPFMGHYDKVRGSYLAAAPAGSVFITVYSIWHRRSKRTGQWDTQLTKIRLLEKCRSSARLDSRAPLRFRDSRLRATRSLRLDRSSGTCTTLPRCSTGCAARATSSNSKAARRGRSQSPTTASWTNPSESQRQTEPAGDRLGQSTRFPLRRAAVGYLRTLVLSRTNVTRSGLVHPATQFGVFQSQVSAQPALHLQRIARGFVPTRVCSKSLTQQNRW